MKNKRWFNKDSKDNFYSKNILLPVGTGTVKVKPNSTISVYLAGIIRIRLHRISGQIGTVSGIQVH